MWVVISEGIKFNEEICGFMQASRSWSILRILMLESFGLKQSLPDPFVFKLFEEGSKDNLKMISIAYVDDRIVAGKVEPTETLRRIPNDSFPTKNLSKLAHCNGC